MLFVRTTFLENIVSAGSKLLENNSNSNEILVNLKNFFSFLHLVSFYITYLGKISLRIKHFCFFNMSNYHMLFTKCSLWGCSAWRMLLLVLIMKPGMMCSWCADARPAIGRTTAVWGILGGFHSRIKPAAITTYFVDCEDFGESNSYDPFWVSSLLGY